MVLFTENKGVIHVRHHNHKRDAQAVAGSVVGHDAGTHPSKSSRERRSLWPLRVRCLTLGCPGVGDTSSPRTDLELQTKGADLWG